MCSRSLRPRKRGLLQGQSAVYHVFCQAADNRHHLTEIPPHVFLTLLNKQASFCGVEVLAYCLMSSHFHLLVRVPDQAAAIDNELLLQRYRGLYGGQKVPFSSLRPEALEKLLTENGPDAQSKYQRILQRMHDLRPFMRELKQRLGIWFNHRQGNRGTLWKERYKHAVIEDHPAALSVAAAYIDLNPVRAKLVSDPGEYLYNSYGAAIRGDSEARRGYEKLYRDGRGWEQLKEEYRLVLFGTGTA